MSKKVKRLAEQFCPENYDLTLDLDPSAMVSTGTVIISGRKIGRPSKRLTFHQKGLKISRATVTKTDKSGTKELAVSRINHHKSYDEIRLHFDEMVYPGQYTINLEFSGKISESMIGLYASNFKHNDQDKKIISTQFESHHAREAFPCIDEPIAKATFDLTLITPPDLVVISNTEVKTQESKGSKQTTSFETSPIMSSYLLAWVVGEIHCVEARSKNGTLVRSWASIAHDKESLKYANDEAVKILDFFEDYFDVPFPLKKLDQVALPDFESGAMENWGLITYREIGLINDPKNPSISNQKYTSMVIAHEMSHQWFGNLVTMKWWDDLWLNESFASLMEHIPLDHLHPDWHQWEEYSAYDIPSCSNRDVFSDVQNVGVGVNHPDEINTLFDPAIVYAKGGRLIKMMREYIGEKAFRAGLTNYFKNFAYKNTFRDDLWEAMGQASALDIKSLMTPWLTQSGMPVIKVENTGSGQYKLTQERFVLDKNDDTSLWPIPLLSDDLNAPQILDKKSLVYESKGLGLFNKNGSGHYLVHYIDPDDFKHIIDKITKNPDLSLARINTLNDLMLLAKRGDVVLVDSLNLIKELFEEPRDAVWSLMTRALGLAYNLGENNEVIESGLKKFRYSLAHKNYQSLGWDDQPNDDINTKNLRATMIGLMIASEDKSIVEHAKEIFDNTKNLSDIPSDRRGLIFSAVVRNFDDPAIIDRLISEYKTTIDPDLQLSITSGLTSTKSGKVAQRLIDEGLKDGGFIRPQDIFRWYAYMMRNKHSRDIAWDWLINDWTRIEKLFGKALDHFVIYSSGPINTLDWQKKFDKFFDTLIDRPDLSRNIKVAKSEIKARIDWRTREEKPLQTFFKSIDN